jgi:hypothetical protein
MPRNDIREKQSINEVEPNETIMKCTYGPDIMKYEATEQQPNDFEFCNSSYEFSKVSRVILGAQITQ